jgi:hypothetical protein
MAIIQGTASVEEVVNRTFKDYDLPGAIASIEAEWNYTKNRGRSNKTYEAEINGQPVTLWITGVNVVLTTPEHKYCARYAQDGKANNDCTPEELAASLEVSMTEEEREKHEIRQAIKRYDPRDGYGAHRRYMKFSRLRKRIRAGIEKYPELQEDLDARLEAIGWDK